MSNQDADDGAEQRCAVDAAQCRDVLRRSAQCTFAYRRIGRQGEARANRIYTFPKWANEVARHEMQHCMPCKCRVRCDGNEMMAIARTGDMPLAGESVG